MRSMAFNIGFVARLTNVGASLVLVVKAATACPCSAKQWRECIKQMYFIGYLSLVILAVSGMFVGIVVTIQGENILQRFGAEAMLSQLVALSVYRELGPVLGALLFAGRAGTAVAAELGLMQVTEQIPSLDMMSVNPYSFVLFPRVWAMIVALPCLVMVFNFMAVVGSYLMANYWLGLDSQTYWSSLQSSVLFGKDIMSGLIKTVLFGFIIAWVALYQGYAAERTADGVAYAATRTVVYSSLAVLGVDVLFTIAWIGGVCCAQ